MSELLLGSGFDHRKKVYIPGQESWNGLVTVDINPDCKPDVVWDLEKLPLPFEDNQFDTVNGFQILEHTGQQGDWKFFFDQFMEFWRILKPNGYFVAQMADWQSEQAWGDPSHKRIINRITLEFLSQKSYAINKEKNSPMTDFTNYFKGNFDIIMTDVQDGMFAFVLKALK